MNRSILIVICDFLLISLLVFSSVDINRVAEEGRQTTAARVEVVTNGVGSAGQDLAAVMQLALDEERKSREQLLEELSKARSTASERESQTRTLQQQLETREQEAGRLLQRQATLEQQFAAARTNLQRLNEQLQAVSGEATQSQERLSQTEAEARKQAEMAAALQRQLADLARSNQMVLNEKQQLATRLQVAEVEKRYAQDHARAMQEQVKVEREEKAKLAAGVEVLANKSGELVQEIRENRPLAPNTIFNDFISNRVEARINASRPGMFGNEATRQKATETVLVTDGTNIFALCHVQATPLVIYTPGTDWEGLTGVLDHGGKQVPIRSMSFNFRDPRVVWMPVSEADARSLGSKVYSVSADPFKFQDAVLVGATEGYYGECRFQIDLTTPDYVRLDSSFIRGLFGKFNPSRGDLVFSKTGELLGIMVNSTYCMMIRNFDAGATFRFGNNVRAQRTGEVLSALHSQLLQMPLKLQ